jgi:hypothetical protein
VTHVTTVPPAPGRRRALLRLGLVGAALVWLALMTLTPQPELAGRAASTPLWCLVCGDTGLVDTLLNILLFVPYGMALAAAGATRRRTLALVLATTVAIELLQMKAVAGRDASLGDILTNCAGGMLGAWLVTDWRRFVAPRAREARRLACLAAFSWLGLTTVVGWLEERVVPNQRYNVHFGPAVAGHDRFAGRVLGAEVNGWPIDSGHIKEYVPYMLELQRDSARFEARIVTGAPPRRAARIADLGIGYPDPNPRGVLILEQQGRDAIFQWRMRTQEFHLRSPALRLPRALPAEPGDTVIVAGAYGHDRLWLTTTLAGRPATARSIAVPLSPSWSWVMLLPFEYEFGPEVYALTALWLACLLLLPGYWAGRADAQRGGRTTGALIAAAVIVGLGGVPLLVTLPAVPWTEWAGALTGGLLGYLAGARGVAWLGPVGADAPRPLDDAELADLREA